MRCIKLICVLVVSFLIVGSNPISKALYLDNKPDINFVYAKKISQSSIQLRWFALSAPSKESYMEIPSSSSLYTTLSSSPRIAFIANNGTPYIADLSSSSITEIKAKIDLDINDDPLLPDSHYALSRSLTWSPDGTLLAFTGLDQSLHRTIYVYDTSRNSLANLTEAVKSLTGKVEISSWSPDGKWLSLVASVKDTNGGQYYEVNILSRDGTLLSKLVSMPNICRLSWSPDIQHLASYTGCSKGVGDNSDLVIITFDPLNPQRTKPPLTVSDASLDSYWWYGVPLWRDNNTLVVSRTTGPRGVNLSTSSYQNSFIIYNIRTNTQEVLPNLSFATGNFVMQDDWGLWYNKDRTALAGYNLASGLSVNSLPVNDPCPISNTRISSNYGAIALLSNCIPSIDQKPTIRIIDFQTMKDITTITPNSSEQLIPVGFVRVQ